MEEPIKLAILETDIIEALNIIEQITQPKAEYNMDRLVYCENVIQELIKNGHRLKECLNKYANN